MPETNEVPVSPPPPPPPPPPPGNWGQYVIPVLTADAQACLTGRCGVMHASYKAIPSEEHYLRVYAGNGKPDVWERIQFHVWDHTAGLRYVFIGLEQDGRSCYGWVREKTTGPLYDHATGTFWELDDHDRYTEEAPPEVTNIPVTFDSWITVRQNAMTQYIANLSNPEVYSHCYLNTASGVPLRRWNAADEIWDTVEEVVDRVYYKDRVTYKEFHVLLKLVGRAGTTVGDLYPWTDSTLQNPYLYDAVTGLVYESGNVPLFWSRYTL
jgi:hypothetical protein